MQISKMLAMLGLAVMSLYLFSAASAAGMEAEPVGVETAPPTVEPGCEPAWVEEAERAEGMLVQVMESVNAEEIRETTIRGGLAIKNETGYDINVPELMSRPPEIKLPADGAQILIIHTHASEAYTPAGLDRYEANDNRRTADTRYSIVRVGDELTQIFRDAGLNVLHDREIYDYPSYTGSYTRSGEAVERCLAENPGIQIVLDIHRDALGSDGVVYKTMAEEEGEVASQVMLLCGTDESGLSHPNWRGNLALALYLQERVSLEHPTLMRPVSLVPQRYNQHLTPGSLIIEVGSSGNTLQEALAAIRLFGEAAAPALSALSDYAEPGS